MDVQKALDEINLVILHPINHQQDKKTNDYGHE